MAEHPTTRGAPPRRREPDATAASPRPLADADVRRLQALLDEPPAPLEPLGLPALDGYLCGVLVQPRTVAADRWQRRVADADARPAPPGPWRDEVLALAARRHAELRRAMAARTWFDPWLHEPEADDAAVRDSVLPWVAGFALAMDDFPALLEGAAPAQAEEPLALLYLHFDAEDLEDAEALRERIDEIEPPADLAEAAEDIVRAVLLLADAAGIPAPPRERADVAPGVVGTGGVRRPRGRGRSST